MISAFDSFLSYLNTELAGTPVVNWVRAEPADANANVLRENALNLSILSVEEYGSSEEILVSLDILAYGERQAMGWAKRTRDVLIQQQLCPELDHEANPAAPVATGRYVSWSTDDVGFTVVQTAQNFVHLNATFPIRHTRS